MDYIKTVIPWVPLLPLFGAVFMGLFGKKIQKALGENITGILGCTTPAISAVLAFSSYVVLRGLPEAERIIRLDFMSWVKIADFQVDWAFTYDPLSALMIMIVTGIGTLIHIYSMGYMHGDKSFWRFFTYINLFLASMLMLVLGDNLLVMFIGWEGVGLCSYLLIGFWFSEEANAQAGKKAFLTNRVGDLGFLTGIFLLFMYSSANPDFDMVNLSFTQLHARIDYLAVQTFMGFPLLNVVGLAFFVGAMGKSAQIPLYIWLPDAMAGPTPVSALIHAATMVTAGVYMMARMNFLYSMAPDTLMFVSIIAAATCFLSATIGMAQFDIKKVLAYSTVSQLGYMFLGVSVGAYSAGVFHLLTHAAFKAALFMGSGSVIVAMHHEQDMRKMGGLLKKLPITGGSMIAATLAIMGFPMTSGFFSKDEILWKAYIQGNFWLWFVGFAAAGITSFYMWRLIFMTFFGETRADHHTWDHCHEQPKRTVVPIAILAAVAILIGWWNVPHFLGGHTNFSEWLSPVVQDLEVKPSEHFKSLNLQMAAENHGEEASHDTLAEAEGNEGHNVHEGGHEDHTVMEWTLMLLSIAWTFITAGIAYYFYMVKPKQREKVMENEKMQFAFKVLNNKYYVDEFYEWAIYNNIRRLYNFFSNFDKYIVDGIVNGLAWAGKKLSVFTGLFDNQVVDGHVNGAAWIAQRGGKWFSTMQSGRIQAVVASSLVIFFVFIISVLIVLA